VVGTNEIEQEGCNIGVGQYHPGRNLFPRGEAYPERSPVADQHPFYSRTQTQPSTVGAQAGFERLGD
jgi:hypothetical protein